MRDWIRSYYVRYKLLILLKHAVYTNLKISFCFVDFKPIIILMIAIDDRWAVLDSAVFGKLHPCQSLSKRVKLLEDSIYEEGAKIFGHSPPTIKIFLSQAVVLLIPSA